MTLLQNAQKQKVTDLNIEKEKLEKLEATVQKTTTSLKENKVNLETEASELDGKIANLKQQLADNQSTLQKIAQSKEVETARLAAEKAAKEKAAAEKAAAEKAAKEAQAAQKEAEAEKPTSSTNNSSSNSSGANSESSTNSSNKPNNNGSNSNSNNSESNTNNNTNNNGGNSSSGGRTLIMESTAYSYAEAGASYLTASGTDLRENPQAVAVDPSVIPLGTVVEVQGYGVALALDTGGAIKGNIIDVHFPTVAQCTKWGRRQVQVIIRG